MPRPLEEVARDVVSLFSCAGLAYDPRRIIDELREALAERDKELRRIMDELKETDERAAAIRRKKDPQFTVADAYASIRQYVYINKGKMVR